MKKKILISGGAGSLGKSINSDKFIIFKPSSSIMDITSYKEVEKEVIIRTPDYFIHTAALTRPMVEHVTNPIKSIKTNIIGTSNVVNACIKYGIKLIYISTDYIYPGYKGNYLENNPVFPVNEYAWSKLGGECAVKLYNNSLILRVGMIDTPFPHTHALDDVYKSSISVKEVSEHILSLLDENGIINVGNERSTVYNYVNSLNSNIKKISRQDIKDVKIAKDSSMNISKLKKILKNG